MSQEELTAARVIIVLDKKEFQLTRLTDRDMAELDLWLRAEFIKIARASLTPDMTKQEREEVLTIAMKQGSTITWLSGQGREMISNPAGLARILWQCVKTHHPDLTYEDIRTTMYSAENVEAFTVTMKDLNPTIPKGMRKTKSHGQKKAKRLKIKRNSIKRSH